MPSKGRVSPVRLPRIGPRLPSGRQNQLPALPASSTLVCQLGRTTEIASQTHRIDYAKYPYLWSGAAKGIKATIRNNDGTIVGIDQFLGIQCPPVLQLNHTYGEPLEHRNAPSRSHSLGPKKEIKMLFHKGTRRIACLAVVACVPLLVQSSLAQQTATGTPAAAQRGGAGGSRIRACNSGPITLRTPT
jgi:hypothetical protein